MIWDQPRMLPWGLSPLPTLRAETQLLVLTRPLPPQQDLPEGWEDAVIVVPSGCQVGPA
jgi:hypothetical protein